MSVTLILGSPFLRQLGVEEFDPSVGLDEPLAEVFELGQQPIPFHFLQGLPALRGVCDQGACLLKHNDEVANIGRS
jgi:hypothetical protein